MRRFLLLSLLAAVGCRTKDSVDTATPDETASETGDTTSETGDTTSETGDTTDTADSGETDTSDTGGDSDTSGGGGETAETDTADTGADPGIDADHDGWTSEVDCDDADPTIHPGADETCNGIDDDCDGTIDEGSIDGIWQYPDVDGDGYGDESRGRVLCEIDPSLLTTGGDCDDANSAIHPDAEELCNAIDDDCDGVIDDGFVDTDADTIPDCREICPVYADDTTVRGDGSMASPYAGIQQAIDLRGLYCDEVVALDGTYDENVVFAGGDLVLRSLYGADVTVIAPTAGGTAVSIVTDETDATLLDGFTLRGGTGTLGDGVELDETLAHGGGLYVERADPTITNCILEENVVTGRGGGAMLYRWNGTFNANIVRSNRSTESVDWGGGGIYLYESEGLVWDNVVQDNTSEGASGDGAGIMIARGEPVIDGNWIQGNVAGATGGGIRSAYASPLIENNVLVDNGPDGIALSYDDAGVVANNTISGSAENGFRVFTDDVYTGTTGPTTAVYNNLVVDSGISGLYVWGYANLSAWQGNDVWGSGTSEYRGTTDLTGVDGNLSVDPKILGGGDYHLLGTSPCIDAGVDVSSSGVDHDHDGTARPLGGGWDIGAYEWY